MSATRLGVSSNLHPRGTAGRVAMAKDIIVDEVRRIREEQAAKYSFDLKAILAAAKRRQRRSRHKIVSFLSKKRLSA
jgi:hypothetical protein